MQGPDAEASNVNKTNIVNTIDELAKQNMVVNKKANSGYDSFFPYNNLISPIPQMEFASNSTMPEEPNSVMPNLTNSLVTLNATLTGSTKNTNIETLSVCNCSLAILDMNSSKNNILKVEAQLLALKSYVNCKL